MDTIFGFEPALAAAMIAAAIAYEFFTFAPLIFSAIVAVRRRTTMRRKFLFVGSVVALTYGLLLVFLVTICVPVSAFMIYVAPSLRFNGYLEDSWFIAVADFAVEWWWLILPPVFIAAALVTTRYLAKRWNAIVDALQG